MFFFFNWNMVCRQFYFNARDIGEGTVRSVIPRGSINATVVPFFGYCKLVAILTLLVTYNCT